MEQDDGCPRCRQDAGLLQQSWFALTLRCIDVQGSLGCSDNSYLNQGDGQKAEELLGKILAMNTELSIAQYHQMMQAYAWSNEK
eukprot:522761-Amphidinium_carterae.1